ncbi:hydroxymethylbilane synthase [Cryptosporangium aurantiacum]|uniref:Porphobilinogen deaminase n=1 Tax=Cryptosporangium aurantiacum TaxID=134849 RepID=A0A1M7RH57_9ACTN|nr:hydroxymethylbilane synthase [Cryptosporangium aurantiacum]SHN45623.1 hydroxymethylbilane synthase [Cryptosporangium aurantiacum]
MSRPLRLGTRASKLALAQSGDVAAALTAATGRAVELVHISTDGDRDRTTPLTQIGGTGVFVSALRDALLADEIDFAVHSYKDLPTAAAEGLTIAAVPVRADTRDALIARDGLTLEKLPAGARIGTGAPRRIAQLLAARPDVVCVPIRGNVDTRLGKVSSGELDAVVLAVAGLTRLGRAAEITEALDPDVVVPAPAQGALAIECRADDADLVELLGTLEDSGARAEVVAERTLLATLEAGCSAPVAAWATAGTTELTLRARVASLDGTTVLTDARTITVPDPHDSLHTDAETVGRQLAADLLASGADTLMGRTA